MNKTMAIHFNAFREELYLEHLEEAAFQYETRLVWLHDEEIGWQDLEDIDIAIEAHLDALVVGETLALKVCLENLEEADATMLHVIVRVFCRHRLIDRLSSLWKSFDFDDQEKIAAVADALKWECPDDWFTSLLKVFSSSKAEMYPIVSPSVAYLSRKSSAAILDALQKAKPEDLKTLMWSLSRCDKSDAKRAIAALAPFVKHDDTEVIGQAAIALMMMGEARTLSQCQSHFEDIPVAFALGGDYRGSLQLIEIAKKGKATETSLLALGLCGNLDAVSALLAYLKHPDIAEVAAEALQIMSGANLFSEEHVADEVEEDELFEHEIESFKKGELPKNIDGNPFGVEVRKLSTDKDLWLQWFQEHKDQFVKGKRYRNGRLFSPLELLNNLLSNQSSFALREYAYEELVIRYGMDIQFAADDIVYKQQMQLNEIHQWVHKSHSLFPSGSWYFSGQEMPN